MKEPHVPSLSSASLLDLYWTVMFTTILLPLFFYPYLSLEV